MMLHKAVEFAAKAHAGACRKGGDTPYIAHPCEVALLLARAGCDEATVCAGLLHDTVEDTAVTLADVEREFGGDVAALVAFESEDKSRTWAERKQRTIDEVLACDDHRRLMLTLADKLANLGSIAADYAVAGEGVWDCFGSSKTQQHWYYRSLLEAFEDRLPGEPAVDALRAAYCAVFGEKERETEGLL